MQPHLRHVRRHTHSVHLHDGNPSSWQGTQMTPETASRLEALALQPVPMAIKAKPSAFQSYTVGTLTTTCGTNLDRCLLLVGCGTESETDYVAGVISFAWCFVTVEVRLVKHLGSIQEAEIPRVSVSQASCWALTGPVGRLSGRAAASRWSGTAQSRTPCVQCTGSLRFVSGWWFDSLRPDCRSLR